MGLGLFKLRAMFVTGTVETSSAGTRVWTHSQLKGSETACIATQTALGLCVVAGIVEMCVCVCVCVCV